MEAERRDRPVERLERHPAVAGGELELVDADVAVTSAAACLPYVHSGTLEGCTDEFSPSGASNIQHTEMLDEGAVVRKLIVSEFVSLDGVMEAPGGEPGYAHSGWVGDFMGPEQLQYKLNEVREAEALLIGRVTYETFAGAWPAREGEMAEKMNSMPKHVVSSTLQNPAWNNTEVLRGDIPGHVNRLKAEDGGPILVAGSRTLVQALMADGLVDEYRFMVFPVILGSGRRVYPDTPEKTVLELADTERFPSGVTVLTYEPAS